MILDKDKIVIPQPEISKDLASLFLLQPLDDVKFLHFGVVIGPSGCGKTSAMRELCNLHPGGLLYYEVGELKNFVSGLSKEIGMKTSPSGVLDLTLGYISESYRHYYSLPDDQVAGLDMVLEVLQVHTHVNVEKSQFFV